MSDRAWHVFGLVSATAATALVVAVALQGAVVPAIVLGTATLVLWLAVLRNLRYRRAIRRYRRENK